MITIYLVHGTWPHGFIRIPALLPGSRPAAWYEEGSAFRASLEREFGFFVRFVPFVWSGANTIRGRDDAATALAALLDHDMRESADTPRLIIAHSHGGNVALRALERLDAAIPLATMATPFLSIRKRSPSDDVSDALIVGRGVIGMLPLVLGFMTVFAVLADLQDTTGVTLWPLILILFVPMMLRTVRYWKRNRRRHARIRQLNRPLRESVEAAFQWRTRGAVRRERLRRFVFRVTGPVRRSHQPILAVRLPGDEASLALGLARTFVSLSDAIWSSTGVALDTYGAVVRKYKLRTPTTTEYWRFVATSVVVVCLLYALDTQVQRGTALWYVGVTVAMALFAPTLVLLIRGLLATGLHSSLAVSVAPALLGIGGVLLAPFGAELIVCGLMADVVVGSVPGQLPCRLAVLEPDANLRGFRLRHAAYEHHSVHVALTEWIRQAVPGVHVQMDGNAAAPGANH